MNERSGDKKSPSEKSLGLASFTVRKYVETLGLEAESEFLDPKLSSLSDPSSMLGRKETIERLREAIVRHEKIVVFGDYDCDGMTATAIMTEGLSRLGAVKVTPLLASRFDGGYGVSARALEKIRAEKPDVVVTCDCGSSDHATLAELTKDGVAVIVIDHHLVPSEPLPVFSFLNPHQPGCEFPFKGLASCGLAFSVVAGIRTAMGRDIPMKSFLDLVAIGTIADVAPLRGDNRTLVRAGLKSLVTPERPGLVELFRVIGITTGKDRRASDVSFRVAPRLNAPGRLGAPNLALELLLEKNPERASALAAAVEQSCSQRRQEQARIEEEARADAAEFSPAPKALVLGRASWNHGIVGIVAGRLAEERGTPVIVVGFEDDVGRGSVRGPAGFPLFDALEKASSSLNRFGGHQAAAGLEVRLENLPRFRADFERACEALADYEKPAPVAPLRVHPEDTLSSLYADLLKLEPCGEGNPSPALEFVVNVQSAKEVKGGHLKLTLVLPRGDRVSGFAPKLGSLAEGLGGLCRVTAEVRRDEFRGGNEMELFVTALEPVAREAS